MTWFPSRVLPTAPVIRKMTPEDQDHALWRGRIALSDQELERILKSPAKELGPPPSEFAKAGRMNAHGISVFYGALEQSTCISELRPPVGSRVVIGRFELLRTIVLLDVAALAKVYVNPSYFDPDYPRNKNRTAFLKRLVPEIARPVVPDAESLEYLTTQVVAEYLAYKASPRFDGIIYPSSQTDENGNNVVLFNNARGVQPETLHFGSSIEILLLDETTSDLEEDETGVSIWVFETTPSDPAEEVSAPAEKMTLKRDRLLFEEYLLEEPEEDITPTLRLDVESMVVQQIEGVTYSSCTQPVKRKRRTEEERKVFEESLEDVVSLDDPLDIGGK